MFFYRSFASYLEGEETKNLLFIANVARKQVLTIQPINC